MSWFLKFLGFKIRCTDGFGVENYSHTFEPSFRYDGMQNQFMSKVCTVCGMSTEEKFYHYYEVF